MANNDSVFGLITFAWSILASGLGVLLILRSYEKPVSTPAAIARHASWYFRLDVLETRLKIIGGSL